MTAKVLVATTLAAFVMDQRETWGAWVGCAEELRAAAGDVQVDFFAALQVDARGLEPFRPLLDRLTDLGLQQGGTASWWTYMLDDGRTEVTTANRLRHITVGQNLANDAASAGDYTHMLFLAADCLPPPNAVAELLKTWDVPDLDDVHVVGAYCPTYGLPYVVVPNGHVPLATFRGPDVLCFSAAAVMLDREAFRALRWRWDRDAGMTDDPCLQHDAWYRCGWRTYVRPDVVTRHFPESIPGIEHRGHDRTVVRA